MKPSKPAKPPVLNPQDVIAYLRKYGPCPANDLTFALLVEPRRLRDHLIYNLGTLYNRKKDPETGHWLWYYTGLDSE